MRLDADADRRTAWWRDRLVGAPVLALPTDRARPARLGPLGGLVRGAVPADALPGLRALAGGAGVGLDAVLLAGLAVLLHRLTGQTDLVLGSGPGPLPVRLAVPADAPFRAVLDITARELGAARLRAGPSLGELAAAAGTPTDPSRSPLVQVALTVRPAGSGAGAAGAGATGTRLDLAVAARPGPDGIALAADHAVALLDGASVRRLLGQYATLLHGAGERPDTPVGELPVRAPGEPVVLAHRWGGEVVPTGTVVDAVREQARRTPDAPAVRMGGLRLTYAELTARADGLAARLRAAGVGRDDAVALLLPRSAEHAVAVLAILIAGGGYLPLDANWPDARIAYALRDARPAGVLSARPLLDRLPADGPPRWRLDRMAPDAAAGRVESGATADDLAFVIYTSGSTGTPKGVAMPHGPLVNLLAWQRSRPRGTRPGRGRTLHFTTIAFDVAFQEMFGAWTAGDELVVADEATRTDPERLLRLLRDERITTLHLPFVALDQLAEAALAGAVPQDLRDVYTAGEQVRVTPAVRAFFARLPGCTLHNQYGPTETAVICTEHTLVGRPAEWPELPPIGRMIDGARGYVLDARRRPVPAGAVGTLHVGGAPVARGYVGRDELTRERFVELDVAGRRDRVYDTGDLVRLRGDGELDFVGRADGQVKVRGHRVELGEIEAVLTAHPAVAAAVVALRTVGTEPVLVAYWRPAAPLPHAGSPVAPAGTGRARGGDGGEAALGLAAYLGERLPPAMLPGRYVRVDRFGLTASGKLDRAALPAPATVPTPAAAPGRSRGDPPLTPWEELAAEVLGRRLGAPDLDRGTRFLDAGGHSLAALGVVAEIASRSGIRLPVESVLRNPSVAELGATVQAAALARLGPGVLDGLVDEIEEASRE